MCRFDYAFSVLLCSIHTLMSDARACKSRDEEMLRYQTYKSDEINPSKALKNGTASAITQDMTVMTAISPDQTSPGIKSASHSSDRIL